VQNFSDLVQGEHFKIRGSMEGGRKNKRFPRKTGHISETVRDTSKVLLLTNRKWHTPFQMRWKSSTLDDLEDHWQSVRSSIL